jgi:hypothetical protein
MKAGENLQKRGLAGAVVSEKPQDFALVEMDRGIP